MCWLKREIKTAIIVPDDIAEDKVKALLALGAVVEKVRPASIVDKKQVRVLLVYTLRNAC